jgi:two-component sensor histidine kinase
MFKSLANFLHRTPWWALFILGLGTLVLLGAFSMPIHVMQFEQSGNSPEMNRAIKREVDSAFGESALSVAENLVRALHESTRDPDRRDELERALDELAQARKEMRSADRDIRATAREAQQEARNAAREALIATRESAHQIAAAVLEANREALRVFKETGVKDAAAEKQLQDALQAAKDAEAAAKRALEKARAASRGRDNVVVDLGLGKDKPLIDIHVNEGEPGASVKIDEEGLDKKLVIPISPGATDQAKGAAGIKPPAPPKGPQIPAPPKAGKPPLQLALGPEAQELPNAPLAPLSPQLRKDIREKVAGDFYRGALGAGMIFLFVLFFIMAMIAKIFIDRSRAAQRVAELKKKEAEFHSMNRQVTEAKLQALQAQVEPHFLYNTLANVQALTESDPASANKMVSHLIDYLRSALPKMRETTSTVGQEMELVYAYLNILKMRMGARLEFNIAVPEALNNEAFPPLMLPSLVENAIKHGLEPLREGGRIDITARVENSRLSVTVRDTGKGFGASTTSGGGVGLANVRERLQGLFGEAGKLVIEENSPHGVAATIEIPYGVSVSSAAAAAQPPHSLSAGASIAADSSKGSQPQSWWRRMFSALGTTERVWRRMLSWSFAAFIVIAAMACATLLGMIYSGAIPVHLGAHNMTGVEGMAVATLGVMLLFVVLVLVGALLAAIGYGLGALFVGLLIFVPLMVLTAMAPVLVPIGIVAFGVWWWLRGTGPTFGTTIKAIVIGIVVLVVFLKLFSAAPILTTIALVAGGIWWWSTNKAREDDDAGDSTMFHP